MSTKGLVEVENGEFGRLEIKDCGDSKEGFLLMSGASKVRPMTVADSEARSVLGPTGNKEQISSSVWKPVAKPLRKVDILPEDVSLEADNKPLPSPTAVASSSPPMHSMSVSSILRRQGSLLHSSLSLSASCSSDASSGSFHSGASMGRTYRTSSSTIPRRQLAPKPKVLVDSVSACSLDGLQPKKRCAWVTPSTDPSYGTFHDEEWGIPVHDDKEVAAAFCFYILLPKLLVLSGALAELTWPAILSKRLIFREVFADFDPITVSKFNEKKIIAPGSTGSSLLSELKLRGIIENASQISKVIDEFGSIDKYIWSFVNYKPMVSRFRYPRQVPVKIPKADVISKDLMRRGFRSVGPTVIYSFMQTAGITNDHLISCFRFHECISAVEGKEENEVKNKDGEVMESELSKTNG